MLPTQYGGTQAYCLQRCILTDGDYIFPKLAQSKRDERDEGKETAHYEHEALRRGITLSRDIKILTHHDVLVARLVAVEDADRQLGPSVPICRLSTVP